MGHILIVILLVIGPAALLLHVIRNPSSEVSEVFYYLLAILVAAILSR